MKIFGKRVSLVLALVLAFSMVLNGIAFAADNSGNKVERIAGKDRYVTAAEIAKKQFGTADTVVIARGDNDFADGLAASVLAGAKNAPILLTVPDRMLDSVKQALQDLKVKNAYIVGSEVAVSGKVQKAIEDLGIEVKRVGGKNRFETALNIAKEANVNTDTAYIVNGTAFADAMVAGVAAFTGKGVILPVLENKVPDITNDAIKQLSIKKTVVVGSTTVVSAAVEKALKDAGLEVKRLGGSDRELTSVEFAKDQFGDVDGVTVVNGREGLADAVGAAVFGNPILYTYKDKTRNEVNDYVKNTVSNNPNASVTIVGGETVVTNGVQNNLQQIVDEAQPKDPTIESVRAINAKTIEVKFSKAVDTEKAKFEVKKGSVTVNVAKVTFSEDKTSAQVELSSKLTEGEYTVTVTGLTETALTKTFKAENENVSKIQILSDKAIINADGTDLIVGYKVYNQYDEDITKVTSINAHSTFGNPTVNPSQSEITIPLPAGAKVGDKGTLTLVHVETATTTTAVLTISDKSHVADVSIEKLYHEAGKELDADENNVNDYMLVVEVKDQYGNALDAAAAKDDLLVRVSDPSVVSVEGYDAANNIATFATAKIDGKDRTVLKLAAPAEGLKAGKSTITLISKVTGKTASYEVTVKEGVKANTIALSPPELAVANETVTIPYEATDMYGNPLTKANVLNRDVTFSVSATGTWTAANGPKFEVGKDGKAVLTVAIPADAKGKATITAITANQKVGTVSFDVKEAAKPVAIIGLNKDVYTNVLKDETLTFKAMDLIAEDQYGRKMDGAKLATYLGDTNNAVNGKYFVEVAGADPAGGAIGNPDKSRLGSAGNTETTVTGNARGTETLTFKLSKYDGAQYVPVVGSEYDLNVRVVERSDIASYEVKDIPKLYDKNRGAAPAAYNYTVEVFGKLSNGSKVFVPSGYYNVTTNSAAVTAADNVLSVDTTTNALPYEDGKNDVNVKVTVTINHSGETIVKDVTVSKEAPKVATAVYDTTKPGVSKENENYVVIADANTIDEAAEHFALLAVKDQYGVDVNSIDNTGKVTFADNSETAVNAKVTFSNIVKADGDDPNVTGNGTNAAKINNLEAGDTFTVTITFANGISTTAKVIAK